MSSSTDTSKWPVRNGRERLIAGLWAAWSWPVSLAWGLAWGLVIILTPGLERRRWLAGRTARGLLRLNGIAIRVEGLPQVPKTGCILAANHASYLDGLILTAILPPRFAFVIKREVTRIPVVHRLLARLDSVFINRFDARDVLRDSAQIFRRARRGEALAIFPEGTFGPEPGLRPFRRGAFLAASRAGLPVVPIALTGSRRCLPATSWCIFPGRIRVDVLPAVTPGGASPVARARLAEAVRDAIAAATGETDRIGSGAEDVRSSV